MTGCSPGPDLSNFGLLNVSAGTFTGLALTLVNYDQPEGTRYVRRSTTVVAPPDVVARPVVGAGPAATFG